MYMCRKFDRKVEQLLAVFAEPQEICLVSASLLACLSVPLYPISIECLYSYGLLWEALL